MTEQNCCITQPPSDPEKDKKYSKERKPTWRKAYMVDLSTLNTEELWLKKLEGISSDALTSMFKALTTKHLVARAASQGKY